MDAGSALQWKTTRHDPSVCPVGAVDNSPAIHRWGIDPCLPCPVGTLELPRHGFKRPYGTPRRLTPYDPAMNRWATVKRPSGTIGAWAGVGRSRIGIPETRCKGHSSAHPGRDISGGGPTPDSILRHLPAVRPAPPGSAIPCARPRAGAPLPRSFAGPPPRDAPGMRPRRG